MTYKQQLKAARSGDAQAQYQFALNFYNGENDVPYDKKFAFKWFLRAADRKSVV